MREPSGLILLDVVGMTPGLLGPATPNMSALAASGACVPLEAAFPAVTLTAQASMLTGRPPRDHGIVGNGWWWPELAQVLLWRQPHALLQAEDLPTRLRRLNPSFRVAKLFFWFNMYAPVDLAVTPRPMYTADGRKIPDIHTHPEELRHDLQRRFGRFPLFHFWGPMADLRSTRWIADASLHLIESERPDLSLVYLPHLDYDFQRHGPEHPASRRALTEIDAVVGEFMALAERMQLEVAVVSEYGITPVHRPVHPNRRLREEGLLAVRHELGRDMLDHGASRAFAVADHQVAHVYVRDPRDLPRARECLITLEGVERVLEGEDLAALGLDHPRSGQLVLLAERDAWFTWYFWEDDARAPDFARTVDIHRKPGYDPAELFFDPRLSLPKLRAMRRLVQRKLGFRALMDVIGLDAGVVGGSHGRPPDAPESGPILITGRPLGEWERAAPFPLRDLPPLLAWLSGADPEPHRSPSP